MPELESAYAPKKVYSRALRNKHIENITVNRSQQWNNRYPFSYRNAHKIYGTPMMDVAMGAKTIEEYQSLMRDLLQERVKVTRLDPTKKGSVRDTSTVSVNRTLPPESTTTLHSPSRQTSADMSASNNESVSLALQAGVVQQPTPKSDTKTKYQSESPILQLELKLDDHSQPPKVETKTQTLTQIQPRGCLEADEIPRNNSRAGFEVQSTSKRSEDSEDSEVAAQYGRGPQSNLSPPRVTQPGISEERCIGSDRESTRNPLFQSEGQWVARDNIRTVCENTTTASSDLRQKDTSNPSKSTAGIHRNMWEDMVVAPTSSMERADTDTDQCPIELRRVLSLGMPTVLPTPIGGLVPTGHIIGNLADLVGDEI